MITCIIIDDEPIARKGLKEYVQDVEYLSLLGEFEHPLKAVDLLMREKVDLILLDIQMPKITGPDFLGTLSHQPMIIFTTAYPEYAVKGFELNAVDYLVKPFSFERFLKAVTKAKVKKETENPSGATAGEDHFFIKTDAKLVKVYYDDILFVEALQNYVAVHTKDKKHITYLTFKSIEDHLPASKFLKVHKSYIAAVSRIDSIDGNEIKIGTHSLPISRNLKDEVMERILKNRYLKR